MNPFRYQVWSSVLGASVVSVNTDETPLKRKVYAGKAVIAELTGTGTGTYDNVTWKTSDPVTGTVVSYWNDGTSNTGSVSEQNEPLGQKIALEDPEEPFQPESYEQHFNFASDPEWQCMIPREFYGGFSGMPDHCQTRALIAAGSVLPWEDEISVRYIRLGPGHEAQHTHTNDASLGVLNVTDSLRNVALSSTTKKESGEGENQKDGCSYGLDGSPNHCTVQSERTEALSLPVDIESRLDPQTSSFASDTQKDIEQALTATAEIIGKDGNGECATWYGQNGRNALKAFSQQLIKAPITRVSGEDYLGIRQSTDEDQPMRYFDGNGNQLVSNTTTAYRLYSKIEINSTGPFAYSLSRNKLGHNLQPASLESRIAQILHEVAASCVQRLYTADN